MSMVDRVAEVLWQEESLRALGRARLEDWSEASVSIRANWMRSARAAIAAMRDATETMAKAGMLADDKRTGNQTCRHIYRAMIDAALKEEPKP